MWRQTLVMPKTRMDPCWREYVCTRGGGGVRGRVRGVVMVVAKKDGRMKKRDADTVGSLSFYLSAWSAVGPMPSRQQAKHARVTESESHTPLLRGEAAPTRSLLSLVEKSVSPLMPRPTSSPLPRLAYLHSTAYADLASSLPSNIGKVVSPPHPCHP